MAQFVDRLGAFLILVGLSGLAVGGVGVSAAVRAYLASKTRTIATLRTLGADRRDHFSNLFHPDRRAGLGWHGRWALFWGSACPSALSSLIEARLPMPAVFALYPGPLIEAVIYGTLTALIFTLWPLAQAEQVRAATLFRDALSDTGGVPGWRYLLVIGLLILALLGAAIWFSGNMRLTLWTAGGIVGALVLLSGAAFVVRRLAVRAASVGTTQARVAVGRWGRSEAPATRPRPVVLSLGLGLSVLAAVGQIDGNLRGAIARDSAGAGAVLFLCRYPEGSDAGVSGTAGR